MLKRRTIISTSNSFNYSVNATDIITEALETIGVAAAGETIDAGDFASCLKTLNMMAKQWAGNIDFSPGLKAFSRKHGYVFLQKNQGSYSLGPTGDNASLSYNTTTMRISGVATNTTLEVTSTTGMTAADIIGIELDSGSIQWTTISSITDADTLVIPASGLTGAAAAGKRIFAYTTKIIRPLYIENAVLRDSSGYDTPMGVMTFEEYENLPAKATDSLPLLYHYANTLTNGTLYLDYEPSDVTYVLRLTFMATAEDYDTAVDDIAFPQEWYLPLSLGLAKLISPKFQGEWTQLMESNLTSALMIARGSYAEESKEFFQPGID